MSGTGLLRLKCTSVDAGARIFIQHLGDGPGSGSKHVRAAAGHIVIVGTAATLLLASSLEYGQARFDTHSTIDAGNHPVTDFETWNPITTDAPPFDLYAEMVRSNNTGPSIHPGDTTAETRSYGYVYRPAASPSTTLRLVLDGTFTRTTNLTVTLTWKQSAGKTPTDFADAWAQDETDDTHSNIEALTVNGFNFIYNASNPADFSGMTIDTTVPATSGPALIGMSLRVAPGGNGGFASGTGLLSIVSAAMV